MRKKVGMLLPQWQVDKILAAGYGLATFYYGQVEPDFVGGMKHVTACHWAQYFEIRRCAVGPLTQQRAARERPLPWPAHQRAQPGMCVVFSRQNAINKVGGVACVRVPSVRAA